MLSPCLVAGSFLGLFVDQLAGLTLVFNSRRAVQCIVNARKMQPASAIAKKSHRFMHAQPDVQHHQSGYRLQALQYVGHQSRRQRIRLSAVELLGQVHDQAGLSEVLEDFRDAALVLLLAWLGSISMVPLKRAPSSSVIFGVTILPLI